MRGFYMDEAFTGSPSDLQHISHDTNFTAKQWVDNTSASLAPIEATSTASQPYTVGKRLVYGGRLYKVTQAIAQGGTLTPGTNITPDTVDEELSTISTHLSANRLDTEVDISPYVEGVSEYTCPSDGYFHISANGVGTYANGYVNHFNSMLVYGTSSGAYTKTTMFVKKGMLLSCVIGTSGYAIFRPIIN